MTGPASARGAPGRALNPLARWVAVLFILLAAALLLRYRTFGSPIIHVDEQFYLLVADRMLDGAVPYVDIWDRKPIGLFLLYGAFLLPGGDGILEYQVAALLFAAATAFLIVRLAARFSPLPAAVAAGILYLLWLNLFGGEGGQSPVFYNLFVAGSATLTLAAFERERLDFRGLLYGTLAMLIAGLAIQIKYTVVFEGIFFALLLLWHGHRTGAGYWRLSAAAGLWALLGLLPTMAAYAYFHALGHGEAWLYANITSTFSRTDPGALALTGRLLYIFGLCAPLLLCIAAGMTRRAERGTAERRAHDFALWWSAAAAAGVLLFGTYFNHYALPLLVPIAVAAAPGLAGRSSALALVSNGRTWRFPLLLFVPLFGLVFQEVNLARNARGTGSPEAFYRTLDWLRANLRPGECFYVHDGDPLLYHLTGSCFLTRWNFPRHLDNIVERDAIGVDPAAEIRRIMEQERPRIVLMTEEPPGGMNPPIRRYMVEQLRRHYRRALVVPRGRGIRIVYERSEAADAPLGLPYRAP